MPRQTGLRTLLLLSTIVNKEDIDLELIHDTEMLGGFILYVGEDEYDWSLKGRAKAIKQEAERELSAPSCRAGYNFCNKECNRCAFLYSPGL